MQQQIHQHGAAGGQLGGGGGGMEEGGKKASRPRHKKAGGGKGFSGEFDYDAAAAQSQFVYGAPQHGQQHGQQHHSGGGVDGGKGGGGKGSGKGGGGKGSNPGGRSMTFGAPPGRVVDVAAGDSDSLECSRCDC